MPVIGPALPWLYEKVREYRPARELHVLCHGERDWLQFGDTIITCDTIINNQQIRVALQEIGEALGEHAALVIAGANLGLGERGELFLQNLADLVACEISVLLRVKPNPTTADPDNTERKTLPFLN